MALILFNEDFTCTVVGKQQELLEYVLHILKQYSSRHGLNN